MELGARLLVGLLWLLQRLPLAVLAPLGRGFGALLHAFGHRRRRIARRNVDLCFPQWPAAQRQALVREHFALLGRSLLERGLLWYASPRRIRGLIQVEGDVGLAERSQRPVMWLVPHFLALEVAGAAVQLFQSRTGIDLYRPQSSPYLDRVLKHGRMRFGRGECYPRGTPIRALIKRIREGCPLFYMPDQDFGPRESVFVPFFGVPTATLEAPSKMARLLDMIVQPVVAELLPGGQGWRVRFLEPLTDWPTADATVDAARLNGFIEQQVRLMPAQYLWVHQRFKTRPPGDPDIYA
jgi:KDO2-lipid IV(A) lauroyltransferase